MRNPIEWVMFSASAYALLLMGVGFVREWRKNGRQ
jgi:hypothetical protein